MRHGIPLTAENRGVGRGRVDWTVDQADALFDVDRALTALQHHSPDGVARSVYMACIVNRSMSLPPPAPAAAAAVAFAPLDEVV